MYTITFQSPVFSADEKHVLIDAGLARDVLTHIKYEPQLRLICPIAPNAKSLRDPYEVDLEKYPGLSFRFLPWSGGLRSLPLRLSAVKTVLIEEARRASVWHTCGSLNFWDLTTISYNVGRRCAKGIRVLSLDMDPASMLENSGGWAARKAEIVRSRYKHWVAEVDATIFNGIGVKQNYGNLARRSVLTRSVWLQNQDLADPEETKRKFQQSPSEIVRIVVPTRLMAWKGVDDVIQTLTGLRDRLPPWKLDIIGEGPEKKRLLSLARDYAEQIHFLDPLPYGPQFYEQLRSYHIVLVPTRGLEETRVTYDAAASGCVLIHSRTVTHEVALTGLEQRWSFEPGNHTSLAEAIVSAFAQRAHWTEVGLAGIAFMRGRTIDEMHRLRAEFVRSVRKD